MTVKKKTSFTFKLSPAQQKTLTALLRDGNYKTVPVEHTSIAVKTPDCGINLYKSGKCLVQGKGAEEFVLYILEPMVLGTATLGYEDILDPEASAPHMGIDESGKGDFFGPMVIAAAYVDESIVEKMRELDVKDSKNITSDAKAMQIGRDIRNLLGKKFSLVKIGPAAYNKLYSRMRNVNTMLAWGHARAIENLLEQVPDCPRAISDQFGKKEQVENALMKNGKGIKLIQKHKAESDMAVAAASILAREAFLRALKDMEKKYEIQIPKGASAIVKAKAIELAAKEGPEILVETAKCHFKTTDEILTTLKTDRQVLGPHGQATSRTGTTWKKR